MCEKKQLREMRQSEIESLKRNLLQCCYEVFERMKVIPSNDGVLKTLKAMAASIGSMKYYIDKYYREMEGNGDPVEYRHIDMSHVLCTAIATYGSDIDESKVHQESMPGFRLMNTCKAYSFLAMTSMLRSELDIASDDNGLCMQIPHVGIVNIDSYFDPKR